MKMVRNKLIQHTINLGNCKLLYQAFVAYMQKKLYFSQVSKQISINRSNEQEYKEVMEVIRKVVSEHKSNLVPGVPQLNMCDDAVMVRKWLSRYSLVSCCQNKVLRSGRFFPMLIARLLGKSKTPALGYFTFRNFFFPYSKRTQLRVSNFLVTFCRTGHRPDVKRLTNATKVRRLIPWNALGRTKWKWFPLLAQCTTSMVVSWCLCKMFVLFYSPLKQTF